MVGELHPPTRRCICHVSTRVLCLSALLLVAVGGLGVTILLLAGVCVLLASMRCRSTRPGGRRGEACHQSHPADVVVHILIFFTPAAVRREDTELQSWTTSGRQTGDLTLISESCNVADGFSN